MTREKGRKVFISHASEDLAIARDLATELGQRGISFFLDALHIRPGEHWDRAIHVALHRSTHLVLIHTEQSFQSDNVWDEWAWFLKRHKPVIPLLFDETELPFRLERVQYIDFTQLRHKKDEDAAVDALIDNLQPMAMPQLPKSGIFRYRQYDENTAPMKPYSDDDRSARAGV